MIITGDAVKILKFITWMGGVILFLDLVNHIFTISIYWESKPYSFSLLRLIKSIILLSGNRGTQVEVKKYLQESRKRERYDLCFSSMKYLFVKRKVHRNDF